MLNLSWNPILWLTLMLRSQTHSISSTRFSPQLVLHSQLSFVFTSLCCIPGIKPYILIHRLMFHFVYF